MSVERANVHIDRARLFELNDEADRAYKVFRMTTLERREEYDTELEINPDDESVPVFLAEGRATLRALEKWVEDKSAQTGNRVHEAVKEILEEVGSE